MASGDGAGDRGPLGCALEAVYELGCCAVAVVPRLRSTESRAFFAKGGERSSSAYAMLGPWLGGMAASGALLRDGGLKVDTWAFVVREGCWLGLGPGASWR